ncbi:MAG: DHH family phosphoesterase, partial [bacterium]|nr:DHH family phosphoesterase [bacterium]
MKLWKYRHIAGNLSVGKENPLLAQLLLSRNIDTDEKAEIFLNPEKYDYLPFSVFNDAKKVLDRIKFAVENQEKVVIYGDFDTDGVTSTAILYKTLKKIGANVDYYLPDRDSENHGLNNNAIIKLISKHKAKLIITVDCGVSNNAEVNLAQTFKTDVIISDHHEAPDELPKAFAIINPKAKGVLNEKLSSSEIESLCYLSGAGVALKIATAVLEEYGCLEFFEEILPIAAMGTIGDIVPLLLENRRIVYSGLKSIQNKVNLG